MAQFFFPLGEPPIVAAILAAIADIWGRIWWFALPLITAFICWDFYVLFIQVRFMKAIKWVIVEIKVPKNILKTPKSMEQIFAAAHAPYSYGLRWGEKYIEGIVEYWFSFDIVGRAGEAHFYIRMPKQLRNLVESAIYAQYPEAEIVEAEDYVKQMPRVLPNEKFNLYGNEQILQQEDYYPIRTYPMFEDPVDERRVDTMATLMEAISKLKDDEQIWIQILARPTGDEWKFKGEEAVNKMLGIEKEKKHSGGGWPGLGISLADVLRAPFEHPPMDMKEKKREEKTNFKLLIMSPGQREVAEGIEKKIAKLAFETTIRFLYIDKRENFIRDNVSSIQGYFRQFNTQNMNRFRPDKHTMSAAVHGLFVKTRLNYRRRVLYERYRDLVFNHHKSILNIEELATIYHFPIIGVESTYLEKVESKRGGPPAHLPIAE